MSKYVQRASKTRLTDAIAGAARSVLRPPVRGTSRPGARPDTYSVAAAAVWCPSQCAPEVITGDSASLCEPLQVQVHQIQARPTAGANAL